ncbi:uncharacterized protein EI97DRAFT_389003 [Westerdykella ornata]|uniref:Zn(2)-C6 fungal-type domain-containing protein n=1 Tax=Westerdykella ornata TaxID=318751 RepID=A0A6A6JXF4_WESOR|nr:uncharacterized protein EI97DRAFT_389003 [Westerdykella ornata]KAF2280874.1 hypothetical protein EI97DRAFT_389003 [Westerdykella ornata]
MPKEHTDLAVRKKMRKGTHSCFECRRRKIKCIFQPDSPDVCSECFARGSRCIDQEHANPDIVVDHRKNLRERVSRLEALVDSLLEEKSERTCSQTETSSSRTPHLVTRDTFPPTPHSSEACSAILSEPQPKPQRAASDRGHHIPIISAFEDSLNDMKTKLKGRMDQASPLGKEAPNTVAEHRYTITCKNPEDIMDEGSARFKAKRDRAKAGLLSILPPYDQLLRILNSNDGWWQTWRRKCSGTSEPNQSLGDFATKALADDNIGAIGLVALAVGISSDDEVEAEKYIEAVDRFVMFDDEYAATLEGMECLILKAKWYADVGQPRRAWISQRKGLLYAQLMGLHRQRTASAPHESIWWSLYHGDRFLSLLLGLPYAIQDSHCDLTLPDLGNGPYIAPLIFMNKVAVLAGKVIDRNQSVAEQSFAWALQLDQELEDLWKRLDPAWLEYSELMADIENNAAELRERLMAQIVYHQIRVYLHLPFMLKSQTNPRFSFSRNACVNGSREVLRLYQALRTGEVQPLYECKAIDFIGFTAAVLIVLGLYNFGGASGGMAPKDQEADIRLIEISIDIFRRASSEKGGKVALQSAQVLEKMVGRFKSDWANGGGGNPGQCEGPTDFVIPYFGTISVRRGGQSGPAAPAPAAASSRTSQQPSNKRQGSTGFASRASASASSQSHSQNGPLTASPALITPSSDSTSSDLFANPGLSSSISGGSASTPTSTTTANPNTNNTLFSSTDPFPSISYDGFYNFPNLADPSSTGSSSALPNNSGTTNDPALSTQINDDSMNNFPLPTNNFSWQNMPMDIDQDWSWFLNDGVTTGSALQGGGSGNAGGASGGGASGNGGQGLWGGVGGDFSMQTYAGF